LNAHKYYSTVAVSYSDDHVENIIHIPGSPEYIALMQDFTTHPDRLDRTPLDTIDQKLNYAWKSLSRRANLYLGRPGTTNAATLSSMLTSLHSEAKTRLNISITTVGIAFANSAQVSLEEINDALTYAGLQSLGKWQVPDRELNAAYGAYGFGLCSSYTVPYKCEEEEAAVGDGNIVLHVDFTSKTLAANTDCISSARSTYAKTNFVDWRLGRDEAVHWAEENDYWNALETRIRDIAKQARRQYTQLLLTGDRANDEKFLEVVKDALGGSKLVEPLETNKMDLTYVVASGAAVFQRRRQCGWLGCVQPKHCGETTLWEKVAARAQHVLEL
jgi:hypothetical protein